MIRFVRKNKAEQVGRRGPVQPDEVLSFRGGSLRHGGEAAESQRSARRVLWVGRVMVASLTVVFLLLLGRVGQLQTKPHANVAELMGSQVSTREITSRRTAILDRHGRPLAMTRVAYRLFVDPLFIEDRNTFSEHVGYALGYDPVEVEKKLFARSGSRYVVLDHRLSDARYEAYRGLKLSGLAIEPVLVRDYPQGAVAGQLIGFVGREGKGLDGLELKWDERLTGEAGSYRLVRDHRRRPMWVETASYEPHSDAKPKRLSLDVNIQSIAERALAETVEKYRAESGVMVVMDPMTGEVLAMANYPSFDPNHVGGFPAEAMRNRAVTDVFEPGSIFKPLIWASLLDEGVVTPDEMIDCTTSGVWRTPYGRRLRDAHPVGMVTWMGVLIKSSNIGMAIVAERITSERLHEMVMAYGFGESTGSGLPGEIGGLVNPQKNWTRYSQSSIPMGQEIGVTGLQMVRAFGVLANGGVLVTPTLEAVGSPDAVGEAREFTRVISPRSAAVTRETMRLVMTEGTGRRANSELYAMFGKSGTAQLPDAVNGGYHQDRYVSSFVAGAPLDDPRLVVGCFIRNPDRKIGHHGGLVAGPAVMSVMDEALGYLGVPTMEEEDRTGRERVVLQD